jgi:hypothetical protein
MWREAVTPRLREAMAKKSRCDKRYKTVRPSPDMLLLPRVSILIHRAFCHPQQP